MIELMLSMASFSFLLLVIVVGFINIAQLHDEALATNQAQNSAQSAMDELVQGVRNSTGVASTFTVGAPMTTLCLANADGVQDVYYVHQKVLYETPDCATNLNWATEPTGSLALTDAGEQVSNFQATVETGGLGVSEQEVRLTITIGSNNGSTNGAGTSCLNNDRSRAFCSIVTLTSGAVPR